MVLHPLRQIQLGEARSDALRPGGGGRKRAGAEVGSPADVAIVVRPSRREDERALKRLAELDSARVPAAPILVVEADGVLRAARSLHDGAVVADPFHRTAPYVALLAARAEQLRGDRPGRRWWFSRFRFGGGRLQRSGA